MIRDERCQCGHWAHDHTFLGEVCTVCDCDQYVVVPSSSPQELRDDISRVIGLALVFSPLYTPEQKENARLFCASAADQVMRILTEQGIAGRTSAEGVNPAKMTETE